MVLPDKVKEVDMINPLTVCFRLERGYAVTGKGQQDLCV
jgi:hypothetical protein